MRLSERIQNGNTTNFLKSLNEGVKLEERYDDGYVVVFFDDKGYNPPGSGTFYTHLKTKEGAIRRVMSPDFAKHPPYTNFIVITPSEYDSMSGSNWEKMGEYIKQAMSDNNYYKQNINEGAKLDEARSHKEDNEKAAPRRDNKDPYENSRVFGSLKDVPKRARFDKSKTSGWGHYDNEEVSKYKNPTDDIKDYKQYKSDANDLSIKADLYKAQADQANDMASDIVRDKRLDRARRNLQGKKVFDDKNESALEEARKNPEINNKVAPRGTGLNYWSGASNKDGINKRNKVGKIRNFSKERPYGRNDDMMSFETMPNEVSSKYKVKEKIEKGPYNKEYKDKATAEIDKEVKEYKDKHKKANESVNLKEEISEEVLNVADKIADKIQKEGIMNWLDIDQMAAELLGITLDELIEKGINNDIHIALNYKGINNNFSDGDFFTQEYAKEHPEVLEESANLKEGFKLGEKAEILDTCERGGQPIALVKLQKYNDEYVVAFGYTVENDEISWDYGYYYYTEKSGKAAFEKVKSGGFLSESSKTLTLRPTSSKLNEAESLELKQEYDIGDLDDLVWSGARDRWIDYTDEQKEFLIDYFYETAGYIDGNIPTTTEFNDFIWFEADNILEENGMTGETSEEDEEETEEV